MLGSSTALTGVDFNQTLYLGVNIAGDGEMTPRKIPIGISACLLGEKVRYDGDNNEIPFIINHLASF